MDTTKKIEHDAFYAEGSVITEEPTSMLQWVRKGRRKTLQQMWRVGDKFIWRDVTDANRTLQEANPTDSQ